MSNVDIAFSGLTDTRAMYIKRNGKQVFRIGASRSDRGEVKVWAAVNYWNKASLTIPTIKWHQSYERPSLRPVYRLQEKMLRAFFARNKV